MVGPLPARLARYFPPRSYPVETTGYIFYIICLAYPLEAVE